MMDCTHENRRKINYPQRNVVRKKLVELQIWFCPDCGYNWETQEMSIKTSRE